MSDKILKLDQAQTLYQDLRGRIDALPTNEDIPEVPVQDVQINGMSILSNGVANVPIGSTTAPGVFQTAGIDYGLGLIGGKTLYVGAAVDLDIKLGQQGYKPITPTSQHKSVFYGLAKLAGVDMASSSNPVGTYTPSAKQAIQNMLGITDLLSTEETITATAAHALNSTFMMNGKLHRATAAIAIGDAVVEGTNCEVVKADEVFVKNTDIATPGAAGLVKVYGGYGIALDNDQRLYIAAASDSAVKAGTATYYPIVPYSQHNAVYYGLSKLAGVDLKNETVTVGTYPETSKTAIRSLIGAAAASDVTVSDVQVNGTSVLSNGTATIPVASSDTLGVVKVGSGLTINSSNVLLTDYATAADSKSGTNYRKPITPYAQDAAAFYGLAKAAGDTTQAASSNAVGTYTESAKASIRTMLGAASTNIVAVQDEQPTDTDTKVWLPGTQATGVEVPTYAEFQAGLAEKVGFTDYATNSTAGVMKVNDKGVKIENGELAIRGAGSSAMKAGTNDACVITPWGQHQAAFYGLAKAAGVDLASAENITVGTYPTTASAAIRSMLGAVGDVQINGTSVVSNGVASIPIANGGNQFGVTKVLNNYTIGIAYDSAIAGGTLRIAPAVLADIQNGTALYLPIVPARQHMAAFYGLAKAAGDTTQSASDNAVGTYTAEAKSAIQQMLGIDLQSIASEVEIPLVETVTGTTPSITGQPNTRYNCGEVSTLSITPPSAGSIDVIFDSGSTPAVITVPNTVRWPVWFDATALEADTTYEILITDGVYGSVMTWAN